MPLDTTTGINPSRPSIFIDGKEDTSLVGGLKSLLIVENKEGLYRCEACFGNWGPKDGTTDFLYFDRKILDFGKKFQVKIEKDEIFSGKIMALEGKFPEGKNVEITVLAEDGLQNLRMNRRSRVFEKMSDEEIFKKIASDHKLTPKIEVSGGKHKALGQLNQSDLAFLRERCRLIDAEIWISDNDLNIKQRSKRGKEIIELKHGGKLREFSVIADLAHQRTKVVASGWDVSGKKQIKFEAQESVISGELGSDVSGISILKKAFGERTESIVHTVALESQEVQIIAESYLKNSARQFVVGRGTAEPNAKLKVGATVKLDGIGKLFNGKYYVSEICHVFDSVNGFRTEFRGERAGIGKS